MAHEYADDDPHASEYAGKGSPNAVVNTPPGVLLGNLIGIPRKRIQI